MANLKLIKPLGVQNIINKFCLTIGMIPSSYKLSLTYEEQILSIGKYLEETVIPALNNNAEAVAELQALFVQLKDYVENYFDNLDVQNEVNIKLEQMAQSGALAELVSQYLQSQAVIGFNTVNDLSQAINLANGSFAKTYGKNSYNDGLGAFYKIRTRTNQDVVDNDNIVALTNIQNLVGEKIESLTEKNVKKLEDEMSLIKNKKIIFIGDSYGQGYSPDEQTISWISTIISSLNLQNYITKFYGGTGFAHVADNKTFITLLNEINNDNEVTDIICCGGYNDIFNTINEVSNGITNFCNLAKTKFPNATIHIGHIGWTTNATRFYNLQKNIETYIKSSKGNNAHYLNNVEYSLHNYSVEFSSDGIHPNQYGQYELARNIRQAFLYGSCNVFRPYANITIKNLNPEISTQSFSNTLGATMNNGMIIVNNQSRSDIIFSTNQQFSGRDGVSIKLFDVDYSYILGNTYHFNTAKINVIINANNAYYNAVATVEFNNGSVYLKISGIINDSHNNYLSLEISSIQILDQFNMICDATMC